MKRADAPRRTVTASGRSTRRAATTVGVIAALSSLVLTGCSADSGTAHRAAPVARAEAAAAADKLTYAQDLRISDAEQHLVTECMRKHGFDYQEEKPPSLEESRPVGYVQDDVDWARSHGYGSRIEAKEDLARLRNPNIAYRKSLSRSRQKAFDIAMDGGRDAVVLKAPTPSGGTISKQSGGCAGQAEKTLYGDPEAWFRSDVTVRNLRPLYVGRLLADKEFKTAVAAWSRCMNKAGHPFPDPDAARQSTRDHSARQTPAEEARSFANETRIAVADATCARSVSLRSIGERREAHYIGELAGTYGPALTAHLRMQRHALTVAERTVPART
ncbi:hypothetical protein [Streptomyces griseorubiginosus]|uniref:hypothetical protein n=1 Tax=Streptomyces griseorubiginosus TaxID=67304 RepID=UPI002E81FCA9|nr:hypothetical protein [Streptomyces griseorubiginosus]WUB43605.1 hypothetical protein OHN19_09750 [Streptomyces griseorubiginosus]WUB52124.1 hypothetical protein OG942_09745 [Streptomyces griseorubiginosus]